MSIDAAKAKRAGISPNAILSTLSGYYGGQYVSNVNRFSKMYYVTIQSDPKYRLDTESLNNVFVRSNNGEMAPWDSSVNLAKGLQLRGAEPLQHVQFDRRERHGGRRLFVG